MNLPENGASMHDAANTRENDLGCCCDECEENPDTCGEVWEECEEALMEASAEAAWEGARDAYD